MRYALPLVALVAQACGTMGTPVLRHETGESLGTGHFRAMGYVESNRVYPLVAAGDPAASIAQSSGVFQAAGFGVMGEAGAMDRLDLQLGTSFSAGGGGWRVGAKYQLVKAGPWAVAAMFGYGAYSGSDDVELVTATGTEDDTLSLTGKMWEISFPVSFRFTPAAAFYSGLAFYHAYVVGSAGTEFVSGTANDLGTNLGLRLTFGRVEGDLEAAFLRVYDPFQQSTRFVPYLGLACGISF